MSQVLNRIVITGCSAGGKSSLLAELAARGHATRVEPGRQVVQEQHASGGDALPWRDPEAFLERCIALALEQYENAAQEDGVVFYDRGIIDAVLGLRRMGCATTEHEMLLETHRYASLVFFTPPWPDLFAQDAERKGSIEGARVESDDLAARYPELGYTLVMLPQVSVQDRVAFVETLL